jgi:glutaredoxin 3
MSLLEYSKTYVPIYPEFVQITEQHERAHWGEWEAKLQQDVEQWKRGDISSTEKRFISSILRLFTQSDVAVGSDYYDNLIPVIRNNEVRNMLGSFASREGVHQRAYALLNDTLGFGEEFYSEFNEYSEMKEKMEFMLDMKNTSYRDIALSIGKQVMVEGVCLFASFAMLLNFSRFGKLMGMSDVNQWSIRDESIHVHGLSRLFRVFLDEHPRIVTDSFKRDLYQTGRDCVGLEDNFIDLAFKAGGITGITSEETKQYIRHVCDYRLNQLGLKSEYGVANPFEWIGWITGSGTIENFFESNTTNYSKNSMVGSYAGGY